MSPRSGTPSASFRALRLLAVTAAATVVAVPAAQAATPAEPAAAPRAASAKKAPKLKISVSGVPKSVKRQRGYVAKVRVKNTGKTTAKRVRLKVGRAKGVSVRPRGKTKWSSLKPGKSQLVKVRLKVGKKAKKSSKLKLRATGAGKLKASKTIVLRVGKAGKQSKKPAAGPLVGKYFWGFETHTDWAWDNRGLYVVSDDWAYRGLPKGGLPNCTAQTATVDKDGKPNGDGCFPFRYDAGSGAVTVGPYSGRYADGKLTLEDISMSELAVPNAGTRYQVALEHRGFRGLCGLILGCTTWHYTLGLANDGQFVDSKSSLSTFGDGYATPFIVAGNYPPDEHGTYQILSDGRIQLSYANGTVQVRTIGIDLNANGQPDPVGEGLLLDDTNYYPASD